MKPRISSKRLEDLPVSAIRKLTPFATQARKQGVTVLGLNIGDPDIKTPEVMIDVLKNWQQNPIGYAPAQGREDFLESLQKYYVKIGFNFDQSEIIATVGGSEALAFAFFATCEWGDEALVFEPFYSNYAVLAALTGVKLKAVPTSIAEGFHLPSTEEIEKYISPKTRAVLFSNPCNPTGTVYTQAEIERLVTLAKKHHLFLMSDEVYREFLFVDRKHVSIASYFDEIPDQAILLDSLSKRYSLCGARLGLLVTKNKEILAGVMKIAMSRLSGGLIDQAVGAALSQVPEEYFEEVHTEYKKRRDILFSGLKKIPGVTISEPEGAFYVMVGLPVTGSEDFCKWLLTDFRVDNTTVMMAPGPGFYVTEGKGRQEARIAYVLEEKKLRQAIAILEKALQQYKT